MPKFSTRRWFPRRTRVVLSVMVAVVLGNACAGAVGPPAGAPAIAAASTPAAPGPLTVLVTRHAERADDGTTRDPELSAAGHARAAALAAALEHAGVDAVITTQYIRTRDTAGPLVARLGATPQRVESVSGATALHIAELRQAVLAHPPGSVVLVVGHSNTVPLLVRELTGHPVADMPESEYGTLYIVTLPGGTAAPRLVRVAYGAPAA